MAKDANELEGRLIDYIDGILSDAERHEIERELAENPAASALHDQLKEVMGIMDHVIEVEPGAEMRAKFDLALKAEIQKTSREGRQVFFRPVLARIAAGLALLITGVAVGFWINRSYQQQAELEAMKKEMAATRQLMMSMLDNAQSASQRMLGATVAYKLEATDDQIVEALTRTLNSDPNTNVRLAALEALGKFHQQPNVRTALIASLGTQKDPVIQIALIRLMVEIREKEAVRELQRISTDEQLIRAVKDEAHAGLLKLS